MTEMLLLPFKVPRWLRRQLECRETLSMTTKEKPSAMIKVST